MYNVAIIRTIQARLHDPCVYIVRSIGTIEVGARHIYMYT